MANSARKRDSKGKFLPGCQPGPGRPTVAKEEQYLLLLRQTVDLAQWQKAVKSVLKKAQEGDLRAFEALAKFIMPLPAQRLKISEEPHQEKYRVAGRTPEKTSEIMMKRLERQVLEQRKHAAGIRS